MKSPEAKLRGDCPIVHLSFPLNIWV
jgi:hypothetical protein